MNERLHVCIAGRVQGVGFRFATQRQALRLGLSGWVRNRADGCVEAEFEGARQELQQMLEWCRQGPMFASVNQVDAQWESGPSRYEGFHVRG